MILILVAKGSLIIIGLKMGYAYSKMDFIQAIEPSDTTKGKRWFNTSENKLYASDGLSYNAVESDLTALEQQQLEQNLNILIKPKRLFPPLLK